MTEETTQRGDGAPGEAEDFEARPPPPRKVVHYRNRTAEGPDGKKGAPLCNPGLKGREGHIMARDWKGLRNPDSALPLDTLDKRACMECLRTRSKPDRAPPAPADRPEVVTVEPDQLEAVKAQLRVYGAKGMNVALFQMGSPPMDYIEGMEAQLGATVDAGCDVLAHYGLLSAALSHPAWALAINLFGFIHLLRMMPTIESPEALARAHGMRAAEP